MTSSESHNAADSRLLQRVARLEAIDEIRRLKLAYARYCDDGYPADKIGPLYAEDAVFDGGPFGRYVGRDAIAEFYAGSKDQLPWAMHLMTNDVIEVSDDLETAQGTWYLPSLVTMRAEDGDKRPMWILGIESDEYVHREGRWLFANVSFELRTAFDARVGWADELVQL